MLGSPPPTRGTRKSHRIPAVLLRITPAYAGNTLKYFFRFIYCQDHPRLRGEHLRVKGILLRLIGSPPPTRGTRFWLNNTPSNFGITPASAGNTHKYSQSCLCSWDHPRLRGEHSASSFLNKIFTGSPPPTRGTLLSMMIDTCSIGITPAYAGNTLSKRLRSYLIGDHPRLRGEHSFSDLAVLTGVDHPRLRGEHNISLLHTRVRLGSPPPTRGTLLIVESLPMRPGITPAYAGNTYNGFV